MAGQALTKRAGDLVAFRDYLRARTTALQQVAARHLDPERMCRIVVGCVAKTPALQKCSMDSVFRSVLQSAELGLEPGSALGHAYLVPFGDQCTLIVGYRGLLDLMRRTGDVQSIACHAVYEGDEFEFQFGLDERLRHVPCGESDDKKLTHAYAVVRFKSGGFQIGVMTRKQIDAIRGRSRAGQSGPWCTDYAEMARKTVLRSVAKYCPMTIEVARAEAADYAADTGDTGIIPEFDSEPIDGNFSDGEQEEQKGGVSAVRKAVQRTETPTPAAPPVDDQNAPEQAPAVTTTHQGEPPVTAKAKRDEFRSLAREMGYIDEVVSGMAMMAFVRDLGTSGVKNGDTLTDLEIDQWQDAINRLQDRGRK